MVIIDQKDFNKDIDGYLADRRNKYPSVEKPKKRINPFKKEEKMKHMEDELEEIEEFEDEVSQVQREGILTRLFSLMRGSPKAEEYEELEEAEPYLDEDLKEALKISFGWLQKMPPEELRRVKTSGEFQQYKDTLMKYGLVKEK